MTTPGEAAPQATAIRTLARTFVSFPVLLTVVVLFALPLDGAEEPPAWLTAAVLAMVAAGFVVADQVGYRTSALDPGLSSDEARRTSLQRYQTGVVLRFALTELPIIVALALSFALDHGPWPYLVAVLPGTLSLAFHTWPTRRSVQRTTTALEARGARSYLPEVLDA